MEHGVEEVLIVAGHASVGADATGQMRFEFAKLLQSKFVTMGHSSPRFTSVKLGVYQNS